MVTVALAVRHLMAVAGMEEGMVEDMAARQGAVMEAAAMGATMTATDMAAAADTAAATVTATRLTSRMRLGAGSSMHIRHSLWLGSMLARVSCTAIAFTSVHIWGWQCGLPTLKALAAFRQHLAIKV